AECCALAGTNCRPTALRRRASRPQLKRDPLGGAPSSCLRSLCMRISLVLLAFLALTAVACSTSTSSSSTNLCANSGAPMTVQLTEYAFTPSSVTVIDGQSVCWANTGSMTHTVVEDVAGRFGGNFAPGQSLW